MNCSLLAPFAALLAFSACAYEGPTFTATVWRGETAYVQVPDNLVGELEAEEDDDRGLTNRIDGVALKLLDVRAIPYTTRLHGAQLGFRYDWVGEPCHCTFGGPCLAATRRSALCQIDAAVTAKPGTYAVGPLEVRVLDRVLPPPAEWHYYLDLWQHPWATARYFCAEPFSEDHFEDMADVMKTLAACGQKVLTTTLLDLPWNHQCYDAYHSMIGRVKKADGTWVFDYTVFDKYVAFGRSCGIGPDIACYTMCPWGYVVRWQDEKGETQRAVAKPGTPVFDDYWGDFLVDFTKHLKEKGWYANTYIAMDERSPEDVRYIAHFIQQKAPGLKISLAGNRKPSDFKGITIDAYSQVLQDVSPEYLQELSVRREQGYKTTFYVCCAPARPNTFMTSEDDEAFWIGAYPALSGFDGFLRWAANSWPEDPYIDAAFGDWAPGDTFLVYPDGSPSARLIALRAGIVAAEKAQILQDGDDAVKAKLQDLNRKYSFDKALKGAFDPSAARRDIEALVNR